MLATSWLWVGSTPSMVSYSTFHTTRGVTGMRWSFMGPIVAAACSEETSAGSEICEERGAERPDHLGLDADVAHIGLPRAPLFAHPDERPLHRLGLGPHERTG